MITASRRSRQASDTARRMRDRPSLAVSRTALVVRLFAVTPRFEVRRAAAAARLDKRALRGP
jgi:hypothetical protein